MRFPGENDLLSKGVKCSENDVVVGSDVEGSVFLGKRSDGL